MGHRFFAGDIDGVATSLVRMGGSVSSDLIAKSQDAMFLPVPVLAGISVSMAGYGLSDIGDDASSGGTFSLGGDTTAQSHAHYLAGLLLGLGLAFWSCVPRIEVGDRGVGAGAALGAGCGR